MNIYNITGHALERAIYRFDVNKGNAALFLNQQANNSKFLRKGQDDTEIRISEEGVVLVISEKYNKIITCYKDNENVEFESDFISDSYTKSVIYETFKGRVKELTLENLELDLEIKDLSQKQAKLMLKLFKTKNKELAFKYKEESEEIVTKLKVMRKELSSINQERSKLVNQIGVILNEDLKRYEGVMWKLEDFKGE